jgi:hypothetical protein
MYDSFLQYMRAQYAPEKIKGKYVLHPVPAIQVALAT